jgi:hypothetical protein
MRTHLTPFGSLGMGMGLSKSIGSAFNKAFDFILDLVRQDSTFTCSSVRNVWGYTSQPPSASNVPVLVSVPANVEAITGAYWNGSKFEIPTAFHPSTFKSDGTKNVKVLTAIKNRADSEAISVGDTRRLITENGNKKWATATASTGSTAASQPTLTEAATTLTDGNVTWRIDGYATIEGTLLEHASTNKALNSEDLANASWSLIGATVDSSVKSYGDLSLDRLNVTAGASRHNTFSTAQVSIISGADEVITAFVESDGEGFAFVALITGNFDYATAVFDLSDGSNTDTSVGATSGTIVKASAVRVSGNLWRLCLVARITAATAFAVVGGAGSATPSYTSGQPDYTAVDGDDLFVGGVQVESNGNQTSYIKTAASTVTRAATTLSDTTSGVLTPTLFGFDFVFNPPATGLTGVIWGTYVDANNSTQLIVNPTTVVFRKRVGGVDTDLSFTYTHTADTLMRIVGHQDGSGMSLQVADVGDAEPTAQTNANTTALQIAATMEFGSDGNGANRLNDNFLSAKISDEVISW